MKMIALVLLGCFMLGGQKACYAQALNWADSPYNWKNNEYNFNNSPNNWENSAYNWKNSPNNYDSRNGVYDGNGQRVGYEVVSPQGVKNYFDNNGNRVGYSSR